MIRRGRKRHVVTLTREAATKYLLLLSEFPFAILGKVRGKKDAKQLINRIEHQWDTLNSRGKSVRAIQRVSGDEECGVPTSIDGRVYLVFMARTASRSCLNLSRASGEVKHHTSKLDSTLSGFSDWLLETTNNTILAFLFAQRITVFGIRISQHKNGVGELTLVRFQIFDQFILVHTTKCVRQLHTMASSFFAITRRDTTMR